MQNEKYWDKRSRDCNFGIPFSHEMLSENGVSLDARILDVGCGYGRTLDYLAEKGYSNLCGMDYSGGMIKRARETEICAEFIQASATGLPYKDQSFDALICLGLTNHIIDDQELLQSLEEFHRVMVPGGLCLITDYSYGTSDFDIERYLEFLPRYGYYGMIEVDGRKFHHRSHEMLVSMTALNFDFLDVTRQPFPTKRGHKRECFHLLLRKKTC